MLTQAKWICCPQAGIVPLIRRQFTAQNLQKAELDICGLGFFTLWVNGKEASQDYCAPAITDYCPRDLSKLQYPIYDKLSHRALYLSYDLTPYMQEGENTLDIQLADGWFRQHERCGEGDTTFGEQLRAIYALRLDHKDGTQSHVYSNGTEQYCTNHIISSNLYLGELWDMRQTTASWQPVSLLDFSTPLHKQKCPPDQVVRTLTPVLLGKVNGQSVYDAGENISGLVQIAAHIPAGQSITLQYSEQLDQDGALDFRTTGAGCTCTSGIPQIQADTFVSDGQLHSYCPRFVFHAFRYFAVQGEILSATVRVIHTPATNLSTFTSSSETLNWLYDAYLRTQLNNMHGGIPFDCPHRERLGYTGDGQVCAETAMLLLDSQSFYEKWIDDILDCQCQNSGHVQHTAPLMGGGGGPGGWGSAIVFVPYRYYKRWGCTKMLQKTYTPMQRWATYMMQHSENYLVTHEEPHGWCLGDWASLPKMELPEPFVNTCLLLKCLRIIDKIGAILGQPPLYNTHIQNAKDAVNAAYYHADTATYCDGKQGANAFAIDAALAPSAALDTLVQTYKGHHEFDTGFICTDILTDVLCKNGHSSLAVDLLTNENPGSFYTMKAAGSTTIWEYFDTRASLNHPMFGAAVRQLFQCILGIQQNGAGYEALVLAPHFVENLSFARGSLQLQQGKVSLSWERKANKLYIDIFTPIPATLHLNQKQIPLTTGQHRFVV